MKRGTLDHPKTHALAAAIRVERWGAVGILESLWHFAAGYCQAGDVGRYADDAIARAIGWTGDPGALVDALVAGRWLDRCHCHRLRVHGWKEHADQTVQRVLSKRGADFLQCYDDPSSVLASGAVSAGPPLPLPLPCLAVAVPEPKPLADASTEPSQSLRVFADHRPNPEREEYVREVWAAWCVKRGAELPIPSPAELALARALYEDQVPLRIALRAITDCSKPPKGPRTQLMYCEPAFHEAARHWRRAVTA